MTHLIRRLLQDQRGATAIEYGLIGALIAVAIIGGLQAFASEGTGVFNRAMDIISAALTGGDS
ncbi:MAG: Flp family type IVb pilin [Caulobacterales bacterium]|nr:Flp family type IVb pilin [Caulobacterales bacterium]